MATFCFSIRDRRTGETFRSNERIEARNKTEARRMLAREARQDIPQGNGGARSLGYVPFRDWVIIWNNDEN